MNNSKTTIYQIQENIRINQIQNDENLVYQLNKQLNIINKHRKKIRRDICSFIKLVDLILTIDQILLHS